jgi:hypothetical protein
MMDEQHEAPINPYQSPRSDLESEQEAPSPDRVFGLREPIRMQGKLTAKDALQKDKTTAFQKVKTALPALMLLVMFVVVGGDLLGSSWPALGATFACLVLLAVLAYWLLAAWSKRRYARLVERSSVLRTTTFTEKRIVVEAEKGTGVLEWSAFCQCRCTDQSVVLYNEPYGTHLICPKRFFASEHDWTTFLALVRCKLPEDYESARKLAAARSERLAREAPGAETAFETQDREGRQPLFRINGAISWEDLKHAQQLIGRPWLSRAFRAGCLLPLVIAGALLVWLMQGSDRLWIPLVSLAVPLLLLVYLLFVWPIQSLRGQCKRREGPFAPFEDRVWEEGMEFVGRTSAAWIPWKGFAKLTQTDRGLLFHEAGPGMVRFIPREAFSSQEEWDAFLRLVREKLPEE